MNRSMKCYGLLLVLMFLPGCDPLLNLIQPPGPIETGSAELKAFQSEKELSDYFRQQIDQRNSSFADFDRDESDGSAPEQPSLTGGGALDSSEGGATDNAAPAPAQGDNSFSGTTIQEQGVDEADVVKTDGTYLYIIDSLNEGSVLRIVQVNPSDQMAVVSETTLKGYGRDLYLHADKVVSITTGGGFYFYGFGGAADGGVATGIETVAAQTEPATGDVAETTSADAVISIAPPFGDGDFVYERPHTIVTVIDVTSRSGPVVLSETKFDGTQSATRMIDGVLHMVLANYQDYYFDVMPLLGRPELDVASVDGDVLLPTYTRMDADGTESGGSVVTWRDLYHPTDPDGFGVVSLVSLDVDNDAQFTAVGVVAEPGLIYSSLQAMYLTDTNYDWQGNNRTTTDIYKFAFVDRGATPVASGTVDGRVLNQYSMGEHAGNLRVATTIDPAWFFDETTGTGGISSRARNGVYILGQSDASLIVVGKIEDIAVDESIQSARFLGDRGYLVTFLQTDPFFTLDLSDPANPQLVGVLEVPGYSTFLTPMDATHILSVGQYVPPPGESGNWGVQISIFDVTDFSKPYRSSNVIIGADTGAYSEALWDPKAFTYFAEEGMLALPVSISPDYGDIIILDGGGSGGSPGSSGDETDAAPPDEPVNIIAPPEPVNQGYDGLFVYEASATGGLAELGRISTRYEEAGYWGSSFTRGVFIGDKVLAVTNLGVREAAVSDVSTIESELFFGLPYVDGPPTVLEAKPAPDEQTQPD